MDYGTEVNALLYNTQKLKYLKLKQNISVREPQFFTRSKRKDYPATAMKKISLANYCVL